MDIRTCPNCGTRVVPMSDGKCPSCRERVFEAAEATGGERDPEPLIAPNPPKLPPKAGGVSRSASGASPSLKLAALAHVLWFIPMTAGNRVLHVGNQGFAQLIPLIGILAAILAIFYAVRGFKGPKVGLAIAGLVLGILAFILCTSAIVALPGPLQPLLRM